MIHVVRLIAHGRVQGVGFRQFVVRRADALGVAGWVRNRGDGTVEVEAEGPRSDLEQLAAAVARGPVGSQVSAVNQEWSERMPGPGGFRVSG